MSAIKLTENELRQIIQTVISEADMVGDAAVDPARAETSSNRMDAGMTTYLGIPARKMSPTSGHRPAIWEAMLGTVYALSPDGEARGFDYDYEAARAFAGVDKPGSDPRLWKMEKQNVSYIRKGATYAEPRRGQRVLWVKR